MQNISKESIPCVSSYVEISQFDQAYSKQYLLSADLRHGIQALKESFLTKGNVVIFKSEKTIVYLKDLTTIIPQMSTQGACSIFGFLHGGLFKGGLI